ncbi:MAG: threonylcarbamoyl-AMP synthase [Clostridiales bacterium]|nr:threonylcarbamoyl-AMP synthase [Clostridiales bacterium]
MERAKIYKKTLLIDSSDSKALKDAAEHLRNGEVIGFPTETVYGLGCDARNGEAVKKVFEAKGRPADNPLICHIGDKDQIKDIVSDITPLAQKLIDAFMPGPITIVMKKADSISDQTTAGLDTVGVRMPSNPVANKFLKACGIPVAAPSANLSGRPSPTSSRSVLEDMDGYIYAIIDGGDSEYGLESTVVDCTGTEPVILRPGAVTKADIDTVLGGEETVMSGNLADKETPKAPGMKYRHYAPYAQVEIMKMPEGTEITGDSAIGTDGKIDKSASEPVDLKKLTDDEAKALVNIAAPFILRSREILAKNPFARIGLYCGSEIKAMYDKMNDKLLNAHTEFCVYGRTIDVSSASHGLFEGLRFLDVQEVDVILAQGFDGEGLSVAYMNRLGKASGKKEELTPGMPAPARPARMPLPIDAFKDTYTASVLFIDDNNTSLSACCESLMRRLIEKNEPYISNSQSDAGFEIYCESAGLTAMSGLDPDSLMEKAVKEITGIGLGSIESRRADPAIYDDNDLILTVRDEQAFAIIKAFPQIKDKVFSLSTFAAANGLVMKDSSGRVMSISVPDPSGENYETYLHTAKALGAWLEILFPYILKELGASRI